MLQSLAQGGGSASGDSPQPPSVSGQCATPSADGTFSRETQSDGIQGGSIASTHQSSSQPGTLGASDAQWNAALTGNLQGIVGCSNRPNGVGQCMVGAGCDSHSREANGDASHVQNNLDDLSNDCPPLGARSVGTVDTVGETQDGNQGAGDSTNGASDARGPGFAVDTPDGASDARSNTHGAADTNRALDANLNDPATEPHLSYEVDGATDALSNHNGAPDANGTALMSSATSSIAQPAAGLENGATDANTGYGTRAAPRGHSHGQQGRRTRGGARARRRSGLPPPQHPPTDTARTLIDRIIVSLPYLSTLNTRQIGTHTWSDQLVPLIWCATQDNTCEQLREALTAADRGHEALTAFRSWWIEQGIHTSEDAVHTLNVIARQVGVRGPPIRRYQYLQAPIQEHIATLSGAEFVVASDLVRTQQTSEGPRIGCTPATPIGHDAGNRDADRSTNTGMRMSTSPRVEEVAEIDSSEIIESLRNALEQFRSEAPHAEQGNTISSTSMIRIQECIAWLTCSRRGTEQAEQVLTASNVGTRASSAMHEWWTRHGVHSPAQAFTYIQSINQSAHPEQVYGNLSAQVTEDLIQAGGASDLIMQDLTIEQSHEEEVHRRYDEELVCRMRDELLNRRCWDDREECLANSTWLSLPPAYYHPTLEPVLHEIGIDSRPFARLNAWFATQGIRNPREMSIRLDQQDISIRGDDMREEDELNMRIRHRLVETGLATDLRRVIESGLSNRRNTAPCAPGSDEDTCVICWEGATENEPDSLSRWPQCGHVIHRSCLSRWIWACHTNENAPRCPICRRNMRGQQERHDIASEDEHQAPDRRHTTSVGEPQGDVEMAAGADVEAHHHASEHHAPDPRHDTNDKRRGNRPIPDMSRWAGILASSSTAQLHGKTDQLPPEPVHVLVNDLCPATLISGRQHTLAGDEFGSRPGIECYPSDRDGTTAALSRTRINARRQGDDLPTVLIIEVGGSHVQQAVRQAQATGGHMQLYVLAAGQVSSARATDTSEIVRVAHKAWGHRAMASINNISAVGWPWSVDGTGSRYAQIIIASIRIGPDLARTTEAPLIRIIGLPPMEMTHEIKIAVTGKLEDEVTAAIVRVQTIAGRDNLTFKWDTSQIRRQRGTNRSQPGAAQMAIHSIEISFQQGRADGEEASNRAIMP